jgi:hypothetical protein
MPGAEACIDARALAQAAAAAEQAQLVRWILGTLALALALPALTLARIAVTVIGEPSLAADPIALAGVAAVPMLDWLRALAQPATALAAVAGVAIYTAFIGREQAHAHTSRT